jgi:hypothetical protein
MAVVTISRWKGSDTKLAKQIGPLIKRYGAVSVRFGICHSGAYAGQAFWIIEFTNWETYGKAMQDLAANSDYQKIYGNLVAKFELQERTVMSVEDL